MPNRYTNRHWSTNKRQQNENGEWQCVHCQRWLPASAFYKCKRLWNGITPHCKECARERAAERRREAGMRTWDEYAAQKHVPLGHCSKCKQDKPLEEFYRSARRGRIHRCKACCKEDYEAKKGTLEFIEWRRQYSRRLREEAKNDPEMAKKMAARRIVNSALEGGIIERAPCEDCGAEEVEGHHEDYDKPLEVRWLCRQCHARLHTEEKHRTHSPEPA